MISLGTLAFHVKAGRVIGAADRIGFSLATSKALHIEFMKRYFLLVALALGSVVFVPQKAKAGGYFGITVGPAYGDPYPVYYGGYYPYYHRHYDYYDNPYGYRYWRHHRHWHHWHDDDDD